MCWPALLLIPTIVDTVGIRLPTVPAPHPLTMCQFGTLAVYPKGASATPYPVSANPASRRAVRATRKGRHISRVRLRPALCARPTHRAVARILTRLRPYEQSRTPAGPLAFKRDAAGTWTESAARIIRN